MIMSWILTTVLVTFDQYYWIVKNLWSVMSSDPRINLDQILRIEDELLEYEPHLLRLSIFLGLPQFSNFSNQTFCRKPRCHHFPWNYCSWKEFYPPWNSGWICGDYKRWKTSFTGSWRDFSCLTLPGTCCRYIYSKRHISFHGKKYRVDHWL